MALRALRRRGMLHGTRPVTHTGDSVPQQTLLASPASFRAAAAAAARCAVFRLNSACNRAQPLRYADARVRQY